MKKFSFLLISTVLISANNNWGYSFTTFMKGLTQYPEKVGAFFPCSQFVANDVATMLDRAQGPLKILEIGSGTGALTREIANRMQDGDTLDLVEIVPEYCAELQKNFGDNNAVSLFCGSILDWRPDYHYDVIVCSLPFNIFEPSFVQDVLGHIKGLSREGTQFAYVELMWIAACKKFFTWGQSKERLCQVTTMMQEFREQHDAKTSAVYLNITPINVYHLQF